MSEQMFTIVMNKESYKRFKLIVERDIRMLNRNTDRCHKEAVIKGRQPRECKVKPVIYTVVGKKTSELIPPPFAQKSKAIDIKKPQGEVFTLEQLEGESSESEEEQTK